ncbi:aldehyde dehydrogenase family protein [Belliella kenyensis]|uniref:Aldehyde dehydrogenase n=1 Tax=Belliella kenyensis TaxID=1472724 RepID=A0ABV8ERE5_9BACT|nr:aldehyde dehydrogenase family protein [Belliella kenyensis]MCH7402592.1 aldehyde dehydrogenase family protein [Belliella kenyensis]MDN3603390.1 aldehyde dehydrogenase family protein [Belliella kenyensis]
MDKANIDQIFDAQKLQSLKLRTSSKAQRVKKLEDLQNWIDTNQEDIRKAIFSDFKKPYTETNISEIFVVSSDIKHAIKNLGDWMAPQKVSTPLTMLGSRSFIEYEPKGVSLIIAPWNYPFNLSIGPLVSAIAAGCTAIIKPSELTPHTSALVRRLVDEVFENQEVAVFEGEAEVAQYLLSKPFDHIFFTGSPAIGKVVMKAAAEHLSSVTLELGGKSPAIIDSNTDLKDAADKIIWGKFVNCGQTCIAPDYILVQNSITEQFVVALTDSLNKMYNPKGKGIEKSKDYARIVNNKHLQRLHRLLADATEKGARIITGGQVNSNENYFEPTLLSDVNASMLVMQEEIFGPILPIVPYESLNEAITYVNAQPKPLALYVFSKSSEITDEVIAKTSSGAVVVNDCVLHYLQHELPFGGVNNSGIGKAHGKFGFLAFSNEKAILKQRIGLTGSKPLYPPYGFSAKKITKLLLKWF